MDGWRDGGMDGWMDGWIGEVFNVPLIGDHDGRLLMKMETRMGFARNWGFCLN